MPVILVVAAVAVLVGVVLVAMGRGGELGFFPADYAPLKLEQVTATDVALFRPPTALWGYSMQPTDEALSRIASAITERDIEISALQQQVADLEAGTGRQPGYAAPGPTPRWDVPPVTRDGAERPAAHKPGQPGSSGAPWPSAPWPGHGHEGAPPPASRASFPKQPPAAGDSEDAR